MNTFIDWYYIIFIGIIGLCLGSFFNVVILRSLTDESIIFPASKCPNCNTKLKPYHNIPILSYIFLRGKCAFCKEKISIQYPLIEIFTAVLYIITYLKFGFSSKTLMIIILLSLLLIMTVTDIKERVVDCKLAIVLGALGILYNWFIQNSLLDSILGLIISVLSMEILAALGFFLKKGRAFGEADTYVLGAIGSYIGLSNLLDYTYLVLIASLIFIIPLFLYKQYKNNKKDICCLFMSFLIISLIYKFLLTNWLLFSLLIILSILLIIKILKNLKEETNPLCLPFVPIFFISVLYFIFF